MTDTPAEKDTTKELRAAYSEATTQLREQHREDFNKLYAAAAQKRGVHWSPRPSKTDKDRAELLRILKENPELAEEVADLVTK